MDMKIEVVSLPVSDVDRAKDFYTNKLGFITDHDTQITDTTRLVQLTPPGSACSIQFGSDLPEVSDMQPGAIRRIIVVVDDVEALRKTLIQRGVQVSEVDAYPRGIKFIYVSDPDGNTWAFQEFPTGM